LPINVGGIDVIILALSLWHSPNGTPGVKRRATAVKRLRHAGIKLAPKGRPLPGTIASGWKHGMDGGWVRRASRRFGGRSAIEGGPVAATTCREVSK
jgi:hypothetical protein